jgi:hypothetical protein
MKTGRRDALRLLVVGLPVVVFLGREVRAAAAPVRRRGGGPAFPELAPGTRLGSCSVIRVGAVFEGAAPVTLGAPDGSTFAVEVLRHDPAAPGIAKAGSLDVFLNNRGSGKTPSVEQHGLGAMALARWLAQRESSGHPVPDLLTLPQRARLLGTARR